MNRIVPRSHSGLLLGCALLAFAGPGGSAARGQVVEIPVPSPSTSASAEEDAELARLAERARQEAEKLRAAEEKEKERLEQEARMEAERKRLEEEARLAAHQRHLAETRRETDAREEAERLGLDEQRRRLAEAERRRLELEARREAIRKGLQDDREPVREKARKDAEQLRLEEEAYKVAEAKAEAERKRQAEFEAKRQAEIRAEAERRFLLKQRALEAELMRRNHEQEPRRSPGSRLERLEALDSSLQRFGRKRQAMEVESRRIAEEAERKRLAEDLVREAAAKRLADSGKGIYLTLTGFVRRRFVRDPANADTNRTEYAFEIEVADAGTSGIEPRTLLYVRGWKDGSGGLTLIPVPGQLVTVRFARGEDGGLDLVIPDGLAGMLTR